MTFRRLKKRFGRVAGDFRGIKRCFGVVYAGGEVLKKFWGL